MSEPRTQQSDLICARCGKLDSELLRAYSKLPPRWCSCPRRRRTLNASDLEGAIRQLYNRGAAADMAYMPQRLFHQLTEVLG